MAGKEVESNKHDFLKELFVPGHRAIVAEETRVIGQKSYVLDTDYRVWTLTKEQASVLLEYRVKSDEYKLLLSQLRTARDKVVEEKRALNSLSVWDRNKNGIFEEVEWGAGAWNRSQ